MTTKRHDFKILPPPDVIDFAIKQVMEREERSNVSPSLELLFGGKSYIVNGIITKYGHFIGK